MEPLVVSVGEETVDIKVWLGEGGAEVDVLEVLDEENKGVCVEVVVVQRLEAEREDWGEGKHVVTGVGADGRSETSESVSGSDRQVVLEVWGVGEGEGAGCDGEHSGGKKVKAYGDVGESPASSLSISLSSFTSPGGSTPYLTEEWHKKMSYEE